MSTCSSARRDDRVNELEAVQLICRDLGRKSEDKIHNWSDAMGAAYFERCFNITTGVSSVYFA